MGTRWKRDAQAEDRFPQARVTFIDAETEEEPLWAPAYRADVAWDGCIHLFQAWNGADVRDEASPEVDYVHICDVEDWITRLEALRDAAKAHFGPEWPR